MPADPSIFEEIAAFIMDDDFADSFEEFANEHCDIFTDDEESKLEYMNIYKQFQALFESKLENFMAEKKVSLDDFKELVANAPEDSDASEVVQFLLALSEYDVFLLMMQQQAKKKRGEE